MTMQATQRFAARIRSALADRGMSVRAAERLALLPQRSIQSVLEGHPPSIDRATTIAAALGIDLTIGPVRPAPRAISDAPSATTPAAGSSPAPADVVGMRVEDRRLAEMLAVLADEFEALNERGQESLCTRFWAAHPDLRERALDGQGRRLARVAGDFGAR